ncbi:MAG TPA: hypothetical protein DCR43_00865 [Bacteroidales bacterium]|nr:MAG: hypothetical protein A2X11_14690 [Bacteroidetes bacterium GWE2_42_24]OFY31597.1 MAG: hypothetical protein A2X09_08430 [Bacteroidetes bacterium GWF2_43_11]PKP22219.1 MAG: hypothetical protein CVU06_09615 [Bacteroidetes bacterium HGW-Bacteroidetes-22]HAQ64403.1 hypothetical protein [Bacteroidales bacterium]HBZ67147.1 hypothetical protein [Bacteroidales bacterium]
MKKLYIIVAISSLIIWVTPGIKAQVSVQDSVISSSLIYAAVGLQFPGGDMADRYGISFSVGPGYLYKTSRNWLFGVEANFFFGDDVKIADSLFKNIMTSNDFIIDGNGEGSIIGITQRGFSAWGKVGKLFPVLSPNPNSGLFFTLGAGYLSHNISISNLDNSAPQLDGDYRKGYDRLTAGPAVNLNIGYLYLSNHRLFNFMIGFELSQAWTKSLRDYDFDLMKADNQSRSDLLTGFKIGWIIPLYGRAPKEYYFY